MNNNMNLRNILFDNKLTGSNFIDWVQNLRIILRQEKLLYVLENPIPSEPTTDDDVADNDAVELTTQDTQGDRRSSRIRRPPQRYDDMFLINNDEPTTYNEVLLDKDSEKWLQAMNSEMDSIYENEVWTLVDPPIGTKPIGCKWVFKKKIDMDGKVFTYKARLVAKGCSQKYGIDYDETFSPVAMLKSSRIILAIAAYYDYEIWKMDVKTAFLNGHLQEEVYMIQPEGFVSYRSPFMG